MLKNIETMTFSFTETEEDHARELLSDLENIYKKYLAVLPKHQGLILHPKPPTTIQYMRRKVPVMTNRMPLYYTLISLVVSMAKSVSVYIEIILSCEQTFSGSHKLNIF